MTWGRRNTEHKPATRTDTPDHVARDGRSWTGADYDEARANGQQVFAPRTTASRKRLGR
ncbi:hypothetical protein Kpho02_76230 [Kitasatospora phosalacinea]|uniref:Uncharacterized protein n=1 Tax=Kitasatospora phosalacinea TaxID=2065 RepID=A0A9W6QGP6_9ACTN|nr:hypothetical protein [Kitasatospora phosalacinea]GLW75326.1 hypothetical protein Kpho02_76230 [Kitasatospora phosalacinea]